MYSNHYVVEKEVKHRQKQLLKEASRLRLLKAAKLSKTNNRKGISRWPFFYIQKLLLRIHKKPVPTICECPHS